MKRLPSVSCRSWRLDWRATGSSIGACGGNIIEVYHQRLFYDVPAKEAEVDAVVETRNAAHVDEIVSHLRANGFRTQVLSARSAEPVAS